MKKGMEAFHVKEIISATGGSLISGEAETMVYRVVIDSREAKSGDLFVAIIGENHNAHKFIESAYENGCRTFLVSQDEETKKFPDINAVLVPNTELAMGALAKWYLSTLNLRKLAITGSMGKTTTRDMVYAMSSTKYNTGKPIKNYNSMIGISMTIFTFNKETEVAVMEVGMERLGEIHELTEIIKPEIGVITYVGMTHINTLGSRENIYKAKMEITDFLESGHKLIINEGCKVLKRENISGTFDIITVGNTDEQDFYVSNIVDRGDLGISFILHQGNEEFPIDLNVPGMHNAFNCALAVAVVNQLGIEIKDAIKGLDTLKRTENRLQIKKAMFSNIKIIDDSYSSFPEAAKAAVDTLMKTEGDRHVAILAGMNGLGDESEQLHRELGAYCRKKGVNLLIAMTSVGKPIAEGAEAQGECLENADDFGEEIFDCLYIQTKDQLYKNLGNFLMDGDVVLVKGSRIFKMEEVVEKIQQY